MEKCGLRASGSVHCRMRQTEQSIWIWTTDTDERLHIYRTCWTAVCLCSMTDMKTVGFCCIFVNILVFHFDTVYDF